MPALAERHPDVAMHYVKLAEVSRMAPTTLKGYVNRYVRASCEWADDNPGMDDMGSGATHWRVTLRHLASRRRLTTPFSQGSAYSGEPDAENVLECLLSDASGADQDFEAWASDFGMDTDSRRAERTYQTVVRQTVKLRRFLGADFDMAMDLER